MTCLYSYMRPLSVYSMDDESFDEMKLCLARKKTDIWVVFFMSDKKKNWHQIFFFRPLTRQERPSPGFVNHRIYWVLSYKKKEVVVPRYPICLCIGNPILLWGSFLPQRAQTEIVNSPALFSRCAVKAPLAVATPDSSTEPNIVLSTMAFSNIIRLCVNCWNMNQRFHLDFENWLL